MAIDYAEKEREFIDGLAQDTGRDLDGWMRAIEDQSIAERNALIDWLRLQGFTFAKASWLERIHHNGGRLIYASSAASERPRQFARTTALPPVRSTPPAMPGRAADAADDARDVKRHEAAPHQTVFTPRIVHSAPVPAAAMAPPAGPLPDLLADRPPAASPPSPAEIDALLASAKAYRPLAQAVVRDITLIVPEAALSATAGVVLFSAPVPFAALLASPKGLRLYLDLSGHAFSDAKPADAAGGKARKPAFSHMITLTDARELGEGLRAAIHYAHTHAGR